MLVNEVVPYFPVLFYHMWDVWSHVSTCDGGCVHLLLSSFVISEMYSTLRYIQQLLNMVSWNGVRFVAQYMSILELFFMPSFYG